jgi:hypothetical protein
MQGSVPKNSNAVISISPGPRGERRTNEQLIREWLARFAANAGQPLTEARAVLWLDELSQIEPSRLEAAFRLVMRTHAINTIPQIGEILSQIDRAEQLGRDAEAEQKWAWALRYAERHFHPDLGRDRRGPELPPAIERAIAACGGLRWLWGCGEDQLQWTKKRFVASLAQSAELERSASLLPQGSEAQNILRRMAKQSKLPSRAELPVAPAVAQTSVCGLGSSAKSPRPHPAAAES